MHLIDVESALLEESEHDEEVALLDADGAEDPVLEEVCLTGLSYVELWGEFRRLELWLNFDLLDPLSDWELVL